MAVFPSGGDSRIPCQPDAVPRVYLERGFIVLRTFVGGDTQEMGFALAPASQPPYGYEINVYAL